MKRRVLIYIVAIVAIVGCFQDEGYDSLLIFRPAIQNESGGDFTYLEGVTVYAYLADTTEYIPQSFEAALAGIVTNKTTGATLSPTATSEPYEGTFTYIYEIEEEEDDDDDDDEEVVYPYADGEVVETLITGLSLRATTQNIMLVAVDSENEGYAYCNYEVGLNLATTYITLSFRTWRTEPFDQGIWHFVVPIIEDTEIE